MKNNLLTKNSTYIFLACTLHAIILLLMCMRFCWQDPTTLSGKQQLEIVGAYLASDSEKVNPIRSSFETRAKRAPQDERKISQNKHSVRVKERSISNNKDKIFRSVRAEERTKYASRSATAQIAGNNQPLPALLALLHTAIQNAQHYPDSALEMQREGRTTLKFILKTNGKIAHLEIVKSSGTLALDQAALDAVNDATPFAQVDKFIQRPQEYQIDVVFKLA